MSKKRRKLLRNNFNSTEEYLEYAWLELGDVRQLIYDNKMMDARWADSSKLSELIVQTCLDPEYLHFFCKYILNVNIMPLQCSILSVLWQRRFPLWVGSRGSSKSWTLALYIVMRMILHPGCKIAVVGAALRQSMILFNYIENFWDASPILRDICGKNNAPKKGMSMADWSVGSSRAVFLPMGNGERIRGQRANIVIADEMASLDDSIFQIVVRGFASVRSDGVYESVVKAAKRRELIKQGIDPNYIDNIGQSASIGLEGNQIIMAGTPSYQDNHFYRYYTQYKVYIESCGDPEKIKSLLGDETEISASFDASDYAIIRLPASVLPEGMMDHKILEQAQMTMDKSLYNMEYNSSFPKDSEGFFLASSLRAATCPIDDSGTILTFPAKLFGDNDKFYVMGIDPASENDNFAICIIEISSNYRGIVYQWSSNRREFEKMRKENLTPVGVEDYISFYTYHIRDLLRRFNIIRIVMDASGGGVAVKEALKDPQKMKESDVAIFDMDDETVLMNAKGKRILKMVQFTSYAWRRDAHYGLKQDFIDQILLYPEHDPTEIAAASEPINGYESLEDCYLEILEQKTETTFIKRTSTVTGNEQWDVPGLKGVTDEQGIGRRLKRDRFTSLLLANWGCREINKDAEMKAGMNSGVGFSAKRGRPTNASIAAGKVPKINTSNINGRKVFW